MELTVAGASWLAASLHRIRLHLSLSNQDAGDPDASRSACATIDFPSHEVDHINRAGFEYQGDYSETKLGAYHVRLSRGRTRTDLWETSTIGAQTHGQRLNHDIYAQQQIDCGRLSADRGRAVYSRQRVRQYGRAAGCTDVSGLARQGNVFGHATAIFLRHRIQRTATGRDLQRFPADPFNLPNPALKPERVRAFEAGFQQDFFNQKYELTGTYFNNLFRDQINYVITSLPPNFPGEYVNVNQAFAQGAEVVLRARLRTSLLLNAAYTYTSSQYLDNPAPFDPIYDPGQPLLRRPKHSATGLVSYLGNRWGANLGGSFVGRRADSDFDGFGIDHAAGYVRVDLGGWYAVHPRVTAYLNVENALDRHYDEVVGYPALPINFRAGFRFRIGGE